MEEGLSATKISNEAGITKSILKQALFFFIFHKPWKEGRNGFKAYPDFGRGGGKDKFNVNNALICEFRFDSVDINISIGQGKKNTQT